MFFQGVARAMRPESGRVGFHLPRGHEKAGEGRALADLVHVLAELVVADALDRRLAVEPDGIEERAGNGDLGRPAAEVADVEAEHHGRDAGLLGVERDERVEGFERDMEREVGCLPCSTQANGYSPRKRAFSMRGSPGTSPGRYPSPPVKGGVRAPFEHADDGLLSVLLRRQGEERERQVHAFAGTVEDLPVAEIAPAAERNRPRADPAERKGDFLEGGPRRRADARAGRAPGGV